MTEATIEAESGVVTGREQAVPEIALWDVLWEIFRQGLA